MAAPNAIRVRTASGWQDVAIQGPPGVPGPAGPAGTVYDSDQIGVVKTWSGRTAPTNWVPADGTRYTQALYPQGYDFAKTEADAGNTLWTYRTTPDISFTVPNLTDKFILAPGANLLGASGGEINHTLTPAETAMKAHSHGGATGVDAPDHSHQYVYNDIYATIDGGSTANVSSVLGLANSYGASTRHTHTIPAEAAANGVAHNNMPPYVVVAQIVKIKGATIDPAGALVGPPGPTGPTSTVPGPAGATGPAGAPGPGVPVGGTANQVLKKNTATDYDTSWAAATGGSGLPEVYVGPDPPTPRDAQVIWIDTDESPAASLNMALDVWHSVGASGEPVFQNGWINVGGGYNAFQFRKLDNGKVHVRGSVSTGTNSTPICTLPPGYRPPAYIYGWCLGDSGIAGCFITVLPDGTLSGTRGSSTNLHVNFIFDTDTVQQAASAAAQPIETVHRIGGTGEPAFQNGWVNYDNSAAFPAGGVNRDARFRKFPDGRVRLSGVVKNGTIGTPMFTLPAGYRPSASDVSIPVTSAGVFGLVSITAAGVVSCTVGNNGYVFLDAIEFDTETLTTYSTGAIIPSAQSMPVSMDSWHSVGTAGEPAFAGAWANFGSGQPIAGFRRYPDGRVRLRGLVNVGAAGTAIFTLPAGYRPNLSTGGAGLRFACSMSNGSAVGTGSVVIDNAGVISTQSFYVAGGWVDLDSIEFDTETTLVTASIAVQPIDTVHVVGGTGEPAFQNGWVNNVTGLPTRFRKFPDGRVRLQGQVSGGTAGNSIFTLPSAYRPPGRMDFAIGGNNAPAVLVILADGSVISRAADGNARIELDGVEFDSEAVSNYATAVVQGATPAINPVVSTLPVSPVDGQECYYLADATNGVVFHLKYRAASSSPYKWEVVGGGELTAYVGASETTSNASYGNLTTIGPDILVPLAGDYVVRWGAGAYNNVGAYIIRMSVANASLSNNPITQDILWRYNNQMQGSAERRITVATAGNTLRCVYASDSSNAAFYYSRYMTVLPIRVG